MEVLRGIFYPLQQITVEDRPERAKHCVDMFYSFDTADPDKVPDNTTPPCKCKGEPTPYNIQSLKPMYDIKGQFEGFSFPQGQPVTLHLKYREDYPIRTETGDQIDFATYIKGKSLEVVLVDFRKENPLMLWGTIGNGEITITIPQETSEKIVAGVYFIEIRLRCEGDTFIILDSDSTVKFIVT